MYETSGLDFFLLWLSISTSSICWKAFPSLNCFCILVNNQQSIFVWFYFWVFCLDPLLHCNLLVETPSGLLWPSSKSWSPIGWFIFFFFLKHLVFVVPLLFHISFRIFFMLQKVSCWYLVKLHVNWGRNVMFTI